MNVDPDTNPVVGGAVLFAGTGIVWAVHETFDEATTKYFMQSGWTCFFVGLAATLLFCSALLIQSERHPLPKWKVFLGMAIAVFIVSFCLPILSYSWYSKETTIGQHVVQIFIGAAFTVTFVTGFDQWRREREKDGTFKNLIGRAVLAWLGRFTPPAFGPTPPPVTSTPATGDDSRITTVTTTTRTTTTAEAAHDGSTARPDSDTHRPDVLRPPQPSVGGGGRDTGSGRVVLPGQQRVPNAGGPSSDGPAGTRNEGDGGGGANAADGRGGR